MLVSLTECTFVLFSLVGTYVINGESLINYSEPLLMDNLLVYRFVLYDLFAP